MTRRAAREAALQIVFEMSFKLPYEAANWRLSDDGLKSLSDQTELFDMPIDSDSLGYINAVVNNIVEHYDEIDGYISKYSHGWKISRISRICLAVLRLCICELRYMSDTVPASVAINEAVRMLKCYDADDSAPFVNGILGAYYRSEHGGEAPELAKEASEPSELSEPEDDAT